MIKKCVCCGKEYDDSGRDYKILTEAYVPTRIAPLRMPVELCLECEAQCMEDRLSGISCTFETSTGNNITKRRAD